MVNNHYNEIAWGTVGRWMDNTISWGEVHWYFSIPIILIVAYGIFKFWRRPIR